MPGGIYRIEELSSDKGSADCAMLLVHGYLNDDASKAEYQDFVDAAQHIGWRGSIFGLYWDAGDLVEKIKHVAKRLAPVLIPIPGPQKIVHLVRLGVGLQSLHSYWRKACEQADLVGQSLGRRWGRMPDSMPGKRVWVAGHSLGCRVIYHSLCEASSLRRGVVEEAWLFGAALPAVIDWKPASRAVAHRVVNCFSQHDQVLRFFFELAEWQSAMGIRPVSGHRNKVVNLDCSEYVSSHFSYASAFSAKGSLITESLSRQNEAPVRTKQRRCVGRESHWRPVS